MAEGFIPFQPSIGVINDIIRLMKEYFEQDPGAKTDDMIHKVYVRLGAQIPASTDEFQFGQYVFRMIDTYLYLGHQIGHPSRYNEPQYSWVIDECPYFVEIHEALQFSQYYRNILMDFDTESSTSSDSRSTPSPSDSTSVGTSSSDNNDENLLIESASSGYESTPPTV